MNRIYYFAPGGSYTGAGVADIDPRTKKILLPANATDQAPGSAKAKWDGKKWVRPGKTKAKKTLPPVAPAVPSDLAFTPDAPVADERPVIDMAPVTEQAPTKKAPKVETSEVSAVKTVSLGSKNKSKSKANRP